MAGLIVLLIILGFAAYQYLKGTAVKSFATAIIAICAGFAAFAYFEPLGKIFIGRELLVPWAQPLSFLLLFVVVFAILQTIAAQLTQRPVDLGLLAERIGRVVCGMLSGFIISGLLLTAFAMAPLPNKYPYQRFDETNPDAEKPGKVFLNPDGFVTRWFGVVSSGSFSGKRSFAVLHPNFPDQTFLNRQKQSEGISIITGSEAIEIPKKNAAWPAPENLTDSTGKAMLPKSGYNLTIVRVGILKKALKDAGKFTISQLRLICNENSNAENPLAGRGKNIYPVGYLKRADQIEIKKLSDQIKLDYADFGENVKWIDFAFEVPNDYLPVLVEFKQNNVAEVPPPVTAAQAPAVEPFISSARCTLDNAELQPISSAKVYGVQLAAKAKFLADLTLQITDPNEWQSAQTARSIKPAQFVNGKINYVKAELKLEAGKLQNRSPGQANRVPEMLAPPDGYTLLSLKCNNPSVGSAIKGMLLPVLIDLSGVVHYPVGIVAAGKIGDQTIYEVDYCSLTAKDITDGLIISEIGVVTQPFPDTVWLTEQAQSISEFYVLYLVKSGSNTIIVSVQPADSPKAASFKNYEAFLIK